MRISIVYIKHFNFSHLGSPRHTHTHTHDDDNANISRYWYYCFRRFLYLLFWILYCEKITMLNYTTRQTYPHESDNLHIHVQKNAQPPPTKAQLSQNSRSGNFYSLSHQTSLCEYSRLTHRNNAVSYRFL